MKKTVVKKLESRPGVSITIEKESLSAEKTEAVYHLIAFIGAIHDAMPLLKGTVYYSSDVEKRLDLYADTKLRKVFQHKQADYIADVSVQMTQMFREICKRMFRIQKQPTEVVERFDRKLNDLFTECGVYMEYEPIQIKPEND